MTVQPAVAGDEVAAGVGKGISVVLSSVPESAVPPAPPRKNLAMNGITVRGIRSRMRIARIWSGSMLNAALNMAS
jgi:hypothetical protein